MKNVALVALAASTALAARPRAVFANPRADMSDPKTIFAELQKTFTEFKARNDERLEKVEAKVDPLDLQAIEKISAAVLDLRTAVPGGMADVNSDLSDTGGLLIRRSMMARGRSDG